MVIAIVRAVVENDEIRRGQLLLQELNLPADTIPILMPAYSRPGYLKTVLGSLRRASNINKSVLIVSQDSRLEEIAFLIDSIDFMPVVHLYHSPPYFNLFSKFIRTDVATAANVYFLLRFALDIVGFRAAIVLESDVEVSHDMFDYFTWSLAQVRTSTIVYYCTSMPIMYACAG
jgi:hypothetical protein